MTTSTVTPEHINQRGIGNLICIIIYIIHITFDLPVCQNQWGEWMARGQGTAHKDKSHGTSDTITEPLHSGHAAAHLSAPPFIKEAVTPCPIVRSCQRSASKPLSSLWRVISLWFLLVNRRVDPHVGIFLEPTSTSCDLFLFLHKREVGDH